MSEELGKIEKPAAEDYRGGRKLYFVPLLYCGQESPVEYIEICNRYWSQVESQICNLELKLGKVDKIYYELITVAGNEASEAIKRLDEKSCEVVKNRLDRGAKIQPIEDSQLLMEFLDCSRCLSIGLTSRKVFSMVYEYYIGVSKKRNECIVRKIDETLGENESGVLFMREGHQVQFPLDIQVFYVSPPALDEIKRWLRDAEASLQKEEPGEQADKL